MKNLKKIRKKYGLSQTQLAEKSEINIRMIQHYEQGTKDINKASAITVHKLAKALNNKIENLLELKE